VSDAIVEVGYSFLVSSKQWFSDDDGSGAGVDSVSGLAEDLIGAVNENWYYRPTHFDRNLGGA
jgi:hypothetical protein